MWTCLSTFIQETDMTTRFTLKRMVLLSLVAHTMVGAAVQAETVLRYASPAGDANYAWNSKYGPYGYTAGADTLGVGLQMGGQYGNDYLVGLIEIPLHGLAGRVVDKAELWVYALEFDTYFWYGSAGLGWLDTGNRTLTGDVVADDLGNPPPGIGGYAIWSTDMPGWTPGWKSVGMTAQVQADLAEARSFSSFVLYGSRDTTGGIYAAESGFGPYLQLELQPIPEPQTWAMLLAGLGLLGLRLSSRRGT
jgi:hypothetical protein